MKHFATIAAGEPATLEQLIRSSVALRGGVVTTQPIGGSASWAEPPGLPWRLDWMRLVQPRGLRVDLYADESVTYQALGEELWQGIFAGRALPIVVGAPEIREQAPTSGGSSSSSGGLSSSSGDSSSVATWSGGTTSTSTSGELAAVATNGGSGLLAGAIVSGLVASGAGFALWKCRKRRKCRMRPWVVAGLVVSTVVGIGCGAALALREGGA